ncbi:MAG TPA: hypothetical protein VHZ99_09865 [Steroidobacteraceae bacterium]|nr:hypothetical protein [Steroidobacteraceae bacterium]
MPRVLIRTIEQATAVPMPAGFAGTSTASDYFGNLTAAETPLQLHAFDLAPAHSLSFLDSAIDRIAYLWKGAVEVKGHRLQQGSSFVVEHGAEVQATATAGPAVLLVFAAGTTDRQHRAGGHTHLLPTQSVPRSDLGGPMKVAGGMHADSTCPTCEVWLHENSFPGASDEQRAHPDAGVHSHTEDEIIVVTAGQIRLGARLFDPGTALAIAARTLYSFIPGPDGLSFINFRASAPGMIAFPDRPPMDERAYWSARLPRPDCITL